MITSKVLKISRNPNGGLVTTFLLTYPRFIHAEFMTHRVFSRNAASSRAIPIKRMIEAVQKNPAMPLYWGANKSGMQAKSELDEIKIKVCKFLWLRGRDVAVLFAKALSFVGLHKQIANRILEPWSHITVMATATDLENFFALRAHPDAQPEFQVLAYKMLVAWKNSEIQDLDWGEWHLPYEVDGSIEDQLKVGTAQAARTSYTLFDSKEISVEKDKKLHDTLSKFGHWSPFGHMAQAKENGNGGNLSGDWLQYRKTFPNENQTADYNKILENIPDWVQKHVYNS